MSYQIDIEKDKILLSVWRNDKPFINKEFQTIFDAFYYIQVCQEILILLKGESI